MSVATSDFEDVERTIGDRPRDDIRMCNCAGCDRQMIGLGEESWYWDLSIEEAKKLPEMMCSYIRERPYCATCVLAIKARQPGKSKSN